nr:MAG TPA: DNA polymerase I [Caudoviricetes sp.]
MNISIDLETFSDVDISKGGVYRYAESDNFEILLFAYAVDGGEVVVVDMAQGEKIPENIINAITDRNITKWAFNSQFERICLSMYFKKHRPELMQGNYLEPEGWKCSMTWCAYMGLPMSLAGAGAVLGLEQQKLTEGKELIRYFCIPCKPTKANGGRIRNLPEHDTAKWENFVRYNKRDVEVEMAIQAKLSHFPVPENIWGEFWVDQRINDRGIEVDMEFARNAIELDKISRESLMEEVRNLTGLENPNSVIQLKEWLHGQGLEFDSLDKKAVAAILPTAPPVVQRVLRIRQKLAKSSVKKYQAMENTVCNDSRARGMFRFYGASRTGRWCLTGDHEVLTDNGWVRLDEWTGGRIACWNGASEGVSFQRAEAVCFDYDGPMYNYMDIRISQCSTPDHKMRVQRKYGSEWVDMTVEAMSKCRPVIPINGYRYHRGCANPAWLKVLIMTQADGFYTDDGSIKFHFKKQRKVERCKMLLRKTEIAFIVRNYTDGTTNINIPARAVPLWLRQFRTKTFGYWLLDENPDIFFDELPNWDGYYSAHNSIQYTTTNKQNADIVQALAHMSGRCCSMKIKHHPEKVNWSDAYVLNIWLAPKNAHEIKVKPEIVPYKGKVYCAVTSTGYFLVRRKGRVWVTGNSGKSIQLQNLPQNHISDLAEARALVKAGSFEAVSMLYDDVPDTLSQLIRTAFVPKTGYKFVVADFSAIEARVLAYLAKEQWVLDTFAAGKDIYCATASKMFHCNVEKNGENGELRQKGKQATLSCIAEGSLVLNNIGLVPIERVTIDMLLWDGESWVHHDGVIYKGEREVITYEGLTATPDHLVWVEGAQRPIHLGIAAACGAHLLQTGDGRRALWLGRDNQCGETMEETMESLLCFDTLYQMWECSVAVIQQSDQRYIKRLSTVLAATSDTHVAGKKTGCRKIKVRKSKCTRVFKLRRAGDKIYVCICNSCREVFDGSIFPAGQISGYRQDRHEWPLCSWESAFCNESGKLCKSEKKCIVQIRAEVLALLSKCSSQKVIKGFKSGGNYKGSRKGCIGKTEAVESNQCKARLYDIRNAGRHHRFTVSGKLVHNCGYGGSVGALIAMGALESGMEESELQPLVDAWRKANPHIVNFWWSVDGAAKEAVIGRTTTSTHGIRFIYKSGMLFIELPSGRRLAYVKPKMGENRFGGESITYEGTNGTTKKWERLETFGGKLVENCLAEGTLVLTDRGYIPIQMIKQSDLIWDGIEWVTHDGIAYQGIKTTVAVGSLHMTNNHKILTEKGWIECGKAEGFNWAEVRLPDRFRAGGEQQKWESTLEMQVRMWKRGCLCGERPKERNSLLWLQEKAIYRREEENSWNVKAPSLGCMAFNEAAVHRFESSCLQKLWRAWHNCLSKMAGKFREFLGGYGTYLDQRIGFGQNRQRERIFTRELSMDNKENKLQQQKNFKDFENKVLGDSPFCSCGNDGTEANYFAVPAKPRMADRITVSETGLSESVYDIRNCGPRHRFTVLDNDKLRIVSNCTQAMARDILMFAIRNMKDYRIVAHVHDEVIVECPEDISVDSICQLMSKTPDWAEGLTLKAEGYEGKFYQK